MDDKFSRLILLIQSKIRTEEKDREDLLQRKSDISAKITQITSDVQAKEQLLSSLKKDLKNYKRYHLKVIDSILFLIITFLLLSGPIVLLFSEIFFPELYTEFYTMLLTTIGVSQVSILHPTLAFIVTAIYYGVTYKSIYAGIKETILQLKAAQELHKKYKNSDEIQKEIALVKELIKTLTSQLETMHSQELDCNIALDEIGHQISILEKKLGVVKDVFVESSFKVHSSDAEKQLDYAFEQSSLEDKISKLDIDPGKRFII